MKSIDHLRGKLNLVDVVLPDLGIEVCSIRGDEITVHCPDWEGNHSHGDRNPSMQINEQKLVFNCFVCGGGSLLGLVSQVQHLSEDDALVWLEEHSDLAPSTVEDLRSEIERIIASHREQLEPLPDYPADHLFQYEGFHPWLSDRGITREVATEMQIGFDPAHCGIVIPVFFRERLVGIQTRHLAKDKKGQFLCPERCFQQNVPAELRGTNVPKYKNSSNFPAQRVLYNYDNAMKEASWVIVVESALSALYLLSCGIRNVVATFGSGISVEQGQLLYVFSSGVFVWPDNDKAGNKTIYSALKILEDYIPLRFLPAVPGEKSDPGDVPEDQLTHYLDAVYTAAEFRLDGGKIGIPEVWRPGEVHRYR